MVHFIYASHPFWTYDTAGRTARIISVFWILLGNFYFLFQISAAGTHGCTRSGSSVSIGVPRITIDISRCC